MKKEDFETVARALFVCRSITNWEEFLQQANPLLVPAQEAIERIKTEWIGQANAQKNVR